MYPHLLHEMTDNRAEPYCSCWQTSIGAGSEKECSCGEEANIKEWKWAKPSNGDFDSVVLSDNDQHVTFHPIASTGTVYVRGNQPMERNYHYYWEVKLLTTAFGTDIMVGIGTEDFDPSEYRFEFVSLLGINKKSYGLSYNGTVLHNNKQITREMQGFCKGSIIGVRINMWLGTMEFFINRKGQGTTFFNLRRHARLFPMLSCTAKLISFKLIYASSWEASLLVDSLLMLTVPKDSQKETEKLPPGLQRISERLFWLTLPHARESLRKLVKVSSIKYVTRKLLRSRNREETGQRLGKRWRAAAVMKQPRLP